MTLRIERGKKEGCAVIRLVGHVEVEHLEEIRRELSASVAGPVLDLEEVSLVDVETVRFLVFLERGGTEVRNASPYIREWMNRVHGGRFGDFGGKDEHKSIEG